MELPRRVSPPTVLAGHPLPSPGREVASAAVAQGRPAWPASQCCSQWPRGDDVLWASVAGAGGGVGPATAPSPGWGPWGSELPSAWDTWGTGPFPCGAAGEGVQGCPWCRLGPVPSPDFTPTASPESEGLVVDPDPRGWGGGAVGAAPELSSARWRGHLDAPSSPPGDSGRPWCRTSVALPEALFWLLGVPTAPSRSGSGQTRLVRPTAPHTEAGQGTPWGAALERTPGWSRRPSQVPLAPPTEPVRPLKGL